MNFILRHHHRHSTE